MYLVIKKKQTINTSVKNYVMQLDWYGIFKTNTNIWLLKKPIFQYFGGYFFK